MPSSFSTRHNSPSEKYWSRAIILMDMNAFFASVEQLDNPEWQGRPIGITNGEVGTCIITCSYEARAQGIHTGMRLKEAYAHCPDFIRVPAHPERYAQISSAIMSSLEVITPDIEVFSVDEAFLDVTRCQRLLGTPEQIGWMVKKAVYESAGLACSVGVSGDKTTAKYAAKLNKPDGFTVIAPWEARERLHNVPVTELCGIAKGTGRFLAERGVLTCGDMASLPISVLAQRFGNIGRRIWCMCAGQDPEDVQTSVAAPKSVGHGKVVPPDTRDKAVLLTYLIHMSEKVAARLRRHTLEASRFFIGMRTREGWIGDKFRTPQATSDGAVLRRLCVWLLEDYWQGQGVSQIQVTALNPVSEHGQQDMFAGDVEQITALNRAMDNINQRYGEFSLAPARLLNRSSMPNVIAPSWKPDGHRQTI